MKRILFIMIGILLIAIPADSFGKHHNRHDTHREAHYEYQENSITLRNSRGLLFSKKSKPELCIVLNHKNIKPVLCVPISRRHFLQQRIIKITLDDTVASVFKEHYNSENDYYVVFQKRPFKKHKRAKVGPCIPLVVNGYIPGVSSSYESPESSDEHPSSSHILESSSISSSDAFSSSSEVPPVASSSLMSSSVISISSSELVSVSSSGAIESSSMTSSVAFSSSGEVPPIVSSSFMSSSVVFISSSELVSVSSSDAIESSSITSSVTIISSSSAVVEVSSGTVFSRAESSSFTSSAAKHPKESSTYQKVSLSSSSGHSEELQSVEVSPSSVSQIEELMSSSSEEVKLSFIIDSGATWVSNARYNASLEKLVIKLSQPITVLSQSVLVDFRGESHNFVAIMGASETFSVNWYNKYSSECVYITQDQINIGADNQVTVLLSKEQISAVGMSARRFNADYFENVKLFIPQESFVSGNKLNDIVVVSVKIEGTVSLPKLPPSRPPVIDIISGEGIAYFEAQDNWKEFKILTRKLAQRQTGTGAFKMSSIAENSEGFMPSELEYQPIEPGKVTYIQGGYTYFIAQTQEGLGMSDPIVINSDDYPSLNISIEQNGSAFRLWFISGALVESENVVFEFTVYDLKTENIIRTSDYYTQSYTDFYPMSPGTYYVHGSIVSLDNAPDFDSTQFIIDTVFTVDSLNMLSLKRDQWYMMTFGGGEFVPKENGISGALFKWCEDDRSIGVYEKYRTGQELDIIEPGQASWVNTLADMTLHTEFAQGPIDVDLLWNGTGWNQIGNPYTYDIPVSAFSEELEFITWEKGRYFIAKYLKPNEGYWVYTRHPQRITIDNKPFFESDEYLVKHLTYKKGFDIDEWKMQIKLTTSDDLFSDDLNEIGVMRDAQVGFDEYDKPEIPLPIGDVTYLSFARESQLLRTDIQTSGQDIYYWDCILSTTLRGGVQGSLEFEGIESVRALGYRVYVAQYTTLTEVMGARFAFSISSGHAYTLIVSKHALDSKEYHDAHVEKVYNYPNPVVSTTTIVIQTASDLTESTMEFSMYRSNGEKVYGERLPYSSTIYFDVTQYRHTLKGGNYFYEIVVGNKSFTGYMTILP
ncbi:MAG: hypothetical protein OCC49_13090 [Fibrobacterales bacterium]